MSKVIKEKGFKQKANVKHVKSRTQHKAIDGYEKEFKGKFAEMIGRTADNLILTMAKQLKVAKKK